MEVFTHKQKHHAYEREAYAVLTLLGIGGVTAFAKLSAINHQTAGELLGIYKQKYRKRHHVLIQAHEALHSAYMDCREELSKPTRNFLRDWVKRWRVTVLEHVLWSESPGKAKPETTSPGEKRRQIRRRAAIKAAVKQALDSLQWK